MAPVNGVKIRGCEEKFYANPAQSTDGTGNEHTSEHNRGAKVAEADRQFTNTRRT